jgi:hypothetical protein
VAVKRRNARYRARWTLWDESKLRRVQGCGRSVRDKEGVGVMLGPREGGGMVGGFSGLATCGSVWACPVCSAKIAARRQGEIQAALAAWTSAGGRVAFATFTLRHNKRHTLAQLWPAVSDAWAAVTSGGAWKSEQETFGVDMERIVRTGKNKGKTVVSKRIRTIRVIEVTHGANGWHIHVHSLLLLRNDVNPLDVALLGDQMFTRWRDSVTRAGLPAPSWAHGVDARLLGGDQVEVDLADYFVKATYDGRDLAASASMEIARGDLKSARGENRTPFQILEAVVAAGDADDLDTWHEWELGSKKRRQIAWSPGLRAELLPGDVELTDEEIAEEAAGGVEVARIASGTWSMIVKARADALVLHAFETSIDAGIALLQLYRPPARPRPPRSRFART